MRKEARGVGMRDLIQKNASKVVEPGETIQAVFNVQTGPNPNYAFLTWLVAFFAKYFNVIVTDRRILLVKSSLWRRSAVGEVAGTFPRETRLGPFTGKLWTKLELGGDHDWVHRPFRTVRRAAE